MAARRDEAQRVLGEFQDTARRDRVISGVRKVLRASREGRVHRLLLEKEAEQMGPLGPGFPVDSLDLEEEQDLLNAAAAETIRGRGEVYMFDSGALGESSPIGAILRYSD